MFKIVSIVASFLCLFNMGFAQSGLKVHIFDKGSRKPIMGAQVTLIKDEKQIEIVNTDTSGYVRFEPIDTGMYGIRIVHQGYLAVVYSGIIIHQDILTHVELSMISKSDSGKIYKLVNVCTLPQPAANNWGWLTGVFDSTDISRLPSTDVNYIIRFFQKH